MKMKLQVLSLWLFLLGISIKGSECKSVMFIFGDSLSDAGNNRYLSKSLATANLPWYGIDYGDGLPNGRFTNGRNVPDIIGDAMGLPRAPAFLDPTLDENAILENGVNYASGGAGILNATGGYFIQRLWFTKQIELFRGTQLKITQTIGKNESDKFFQNAVYFIAFGSNDFINDYLMPLYRDSWTYDDQTFMDHLMQTFHDQLKSLHSLGVRKMLVIGLGPLGCIPLQRVLSTNGECQEKTNDLSLKFNQAASKMVVELSQSLPNASYQFGDPYDFVNDLVANPLKYGFENSDSPCCSWGTIRPALTCLPSSKLCRARSKYVFWDEYHPSDAANVLISNVLLNKFGLPEFNKTT